MSTDTEQVFTTLVDYLDEAEAAMDPETLLLFHCNLQARIFNEINKRITATKVPALEDPVG